MKFEAGQIWKNHNEVLFVVISKIHLVKDCYNGIFRQPGYADESGELSEEDLLSGYSLLGSFPDWETAVNSPEFKGE